MTRRLPPRPIPPLRLHALERRSRANGPGLRAVIWVQGCSLGCPGCFNPGTHPSAGGWEIEPEELTARILADAEEIEGVTVTGGEPLEQPEALLAFLRGLGGSSLGRILFTGFELEEIERRTLGREILEQVDAVIAGRYVASKHLGRALRGSSNQTLLNRTARYSPEHFETVPPREAIIHADGSLTWTGVGG